MNIQNKDIYIGLVEVLSDENSTLLEPGEIGFVNILALAENKRDFELKVNEAVMYYRLILKNIEDVEIFKERKMRFKISKEILDLARSLNENMELRFGTFYTWKK